jgi:hypothetical protein
MVVGMGGGGFHLNGPPIGGWAMMSRSFIGAAVLCALLLPAGTMAQPAARSRALPEYRQTAAVLSHYRPVPGVPLDSPAFRKPEPTLTNQDELMGFVSGLARDPEGLLRRLAEARAAAASDHSALVVAHKEGEHEIELPLIDPQSGAPKPVEATLIDSRDIRPTDVRPRPRGYLVLRGATAVADRLALNEVGACTVASSDRIAVESYDVHRNATKSSRESINPDQSVHVQVRHKAIDVPAGVLFVPIAQPAAGIVAAALEPDSPGSYVGVGVIPMATDEMEAPVYRVMDGARLALTPRPGASAALCGGP